MTDAAAYDELADAYNQAFDTGASGLRDPVLEELLGDIRSTRVLSLACGQGRDARLLASLGASVIGIDVSQQMLRYAREHEAAEPGGIEYIHGSAEDLGALGDETFDGVTCHMALMDIPGLRPTFASVARVLRPAGWFVFSVVHPGFPGHVANLDDYLLDHRYQRPPPKPGLPRYAYHRPVSDYINELHDAGFSPTRMAEAHDVATDEPGIPALMYMRAMKRA